MSIHQTVAFIFFAFGFAIANSNQSLAQGTPDSVNHTVYFDLNKYGITPASKQKLSAFAKKIAGRQVISLQAIGCTDSLGTDVDNLELARKRVESVVAALTKENIETRYLSRIPIGKVEKSSGNDALDRKVEITAVLVPLDGSYVVGPRGDLLRMLDVPLERFPLPQGSGVIKTKHGTVIALPPGMLNGGEIVAEVRDYATLEDAAFAGLTTVTSSGEVLGTGGMVWMQLRTKEGEKLDISQARITINSNGEQIQSPLAALVLMPAERVGKTDLPMQSFSGKRDSLGNITWDGVPGQAARVPRDLPGDPKYTFSGAEIKSLIDVDTGLIEDYPALNILKEELMAAAGIEAMIITNELADSLEYDGEYYVVSTAKPRSRRIVVKIEVVTKSSSGNGNAFSQTPPPIAQANQTPTDYTLGVAVDDSRFVNCDYYYRNQQIKPLVVTRFNQKQSEDMIVLAMDLEEKVIYPSVAQFKLLGGDLVYNDVIDFTGPKGREALAVVIVKNGETVKMAVQSFTYGEEPGELAFRDYGTDVEKARTYLASVLKK